MTRSKLYILILALSALASTLFAISQVEPPDPGRIVLILMIAGLLALAYMFPLEFAPQTKVTLGTSLVFASVLLLEPGPAMLAAALGRIFSQLLRPKPTDQALLNGSQTVLQAGLAGLLLWAAGWEYSVLRLDSPERLVAVVLAGLAMYLVNTLSVAGIIGLELGRSPLLVWWESVSAWDAVERLSQLVLGLVGAIVADAHPWALPLMVVPVVAVYRLAETNGQLHIRTQGLEHRATHDPLTSLPNRTFFLNRLRRALDPAENGEMVAVLFLDLDDLKGVNDTYGHRAGDVLLAAVAGRLKGCLRPEDTAARLGGDEFAVLLGGSTHPDRANVVTQRVSQALASPFRLEGREIRTGVSVGLATGMPGLDEPAELLHRADTAMYAAKNRRNAPSQPLETGP